MPDPRAEMSIFDRMHPRCRAALSTAPFDFNLLNMPATARNWAIGNPHRPSPGRFVAWLAREVEAVRQRECACNNEREHGIQTHLLEAGRAE